MAMYATSHFISAFKNFEWILVWTFFSHYRWTYPNSTSVYDCDDYAAQVGIYPNTGFYQNLSSKHDVFIKQLHELKTENWITRATRVVFIDMTIYNANVNLFAFVK